MARHIPVDGSLEDDYCRVRAIPGRIQDLMRLDNGLIQRPSLLQSKSQPTASSSTQIQDALITTPPARLELRQNNPQDCSNLIIASVNRATVEISRTIIALNATFSQRLQQASISASNGIKSAQNSASSMIDVVNRSAIIATSSAFSSVTVAQLAVNSANLALTSVSSASSSDVSRLSSSLSLVQAQLDSAQVSASSALSAAQSAAVSASSALSAEQSAAASASSALSAAQSAAASAGVTIPSVPAAVPAPIAASASASASAALQDQSSPLLQVGNTISLTPTQAAAILIGAVLGSVLLSLATYFFVSRMRRKGRDSYLNDDRVIRSPKRLPPRLSSAFRTGNTMVLRFNPSIPDVSVPKSSALRQPDDSPAAFSIPEEKEASPTINQSSDNLGNGPFTTKVAAWPLRVSATESSSTAPKEPPSPNLTAWPLKVEANDLIGIKPSIPLSFNSMQRLSSPTDLDLKHISSDSTEVLSKLSSISTTSGYQESLSDLSVVDSLEDLPDEPAKEPDKEPMEIQILEIRPEEFEGPTKDAIAQFVNRPIEESYEKPMVVLDHKLPKGSGAEYTAEKFQEPIEEAIQDSTAEAIQEPIVETVQEPIARNIEEPVEVEVEESAEAEAEDLFEAEVEELVRTEVEEPVKVNVEEPTIVKLVGELAEEPTETPNTEPVEGQVVQRVENLEFLTMGDSLKSQPEEASDKPFEDLTQEVSEESTQEQAVETGPASVPQEDELVEDSVLPEIDELISEISRQSDLLDDQDLSWPSSPVETATSLPVPNQGSLVRAASPPNQDIDSRTLAEIRDRTISPLRRNPVTFSRPKEQEPPLPLRFQIDEPRELSPLRRNPPARNITSILLENETVPSSEAEAKEPEVDDRETRGRSMIRTSDIIEARLSAIAQLKKEEDASKNESGSKERESSQPRRTVVPTTNSAEMMDRNLSPLRRNPSNPPAGKQASPLSTSLLRPIPIPVSAEINDRDVSPLRRNPPMPLDSSTTVSSTTDSLQRPAEAPRNNAQFSQALSKFQNLASQNRQDAIKASTEVISRAIAGIYIPGSLREQAARNMSKSRERGKSRVRDIGPR